MAFGVIKQLGDDAVQAELMPKIEKWYGEVRELLPSLPKTINIYFFAQNDPGIMKEYGVGGYAYSSEIMSLGFDLGFANKEEQLQQLRSTVYHEGLHIAQGYTGECTELPLLDCVVYEGLASVFEREYAGMEQVYADYKNEVKLIPEWIKLMSKIGPNWEYATYAKWGFKDEETGEKYKLYKSGTWLIDTILQSNPRLTVLDLTKMSAEEVLKLVKN